MAQAVSIQPDQLSLKQKSYAMTAWNSTEGILADVERRVNEHAPQAARAGRPPVLGRSAKALASAAKTKRQALISRGRKRQVEPTDYDPKAGQDDVEDVEIVDSPFAPMVPIPAFVAATLMEGYESDPIELCWQTIEEIRKCASADEDAVDALRLGEVALYVPRWLFSTAINVRLASNSSTPFGVANRTACHLRMDEWTQEVHRRRLAVRARSILSRGDAVTRLGSGTEDAIRNLSSILERQVATGGDSPQPERFPFGDAFPPTTRQLVLFASEPMSDGTAPTRPIKTFVKVLALSNVEIHAK
jgi:hypothetical protein